MVWALNILEQRGTMALGIDTIWERNCVLVANPYSMTAPHVNLHNLKAQPRSIPDLPSTLSLT